MSILKHWHPIKGVIKACSFCGEQIGNTQTLCSDCKTKPQRKELILKQLEIEKEQAKKGYKISNMLFCFNRQALLEEYNLA